MRGKRKKDNNNKKIYNEHKKDRGQRKNETGKAFAQSLDGVYAVVHSSQHETLNMCQLEWMNEYDLSDAVTETFAGLCTETKF